MHRSAPPVDLRPGARAEWDEALAGRTGATPFHSWEWLRWVAPLLHLRFVALLVIDRSSDEVVGVAPLMVRRHAAIGTANWLPFPYVGPVTDPEWHATVVGALSSWCLGRGIVDVQLAQHPMAGPGASLTEALRTGGYEVTIDGTYVHDLRSRDPQVVLQAMARQRRDQIRRCVDGGMTVGEASADDVRRVLPSIHAADLARHGLGASYPPDLGDHLADGPPDVELRLRASRLADGTTTGVMATLGGTIAMTWLGGALPEFRDTHATSLLYWDAMQQAVAAGSDWIDLVGLPTPGIATFKKRFGGRHLEYPVGHRSWLGYDRLRRLADRSSRRR